MDDLDRRLNYGQGGRLRNVGGTSGGLGSFLLGLVMMVGGGYLLLNQVTVTSGFWTFYGYNAFGLSLIPLLFGILLLFFNGRGILGWLLVVAACHYRCRDSRPDDLLRPTSLFNTLIILVLFVGGVGLIARSLVPR